MTTWWFYRFLSFSLLPNLTDGSLLEIHISPPAHALKQHCLWLFTQCSSAAAADTIDGWRLRSVNGLSDRRAVRALRAKPQVRSLCRQQLICNATGFVLWAGAARVCDAKLWQKYAAARGNPAPTEWGRSRESQKRSLEYLSSRAPPQVDSSRSGVIIIIPQAGGQMQIHQIHPRCFKLLEAAITSANIWRLYQKSWHIPVELEQIKA